ncbi:src substrate cortactin-like [Gastrophryne carolinensis]
MWKAAVGHNVTVSESEGGDDWETDPDFVNDITEEEQRWGAKTIQGSGRPQHIDITQLRSSVSKEHEQIKKKELQAGPKASYGYGGQFGTEKDRMDKSALGHDYRAEVEKHSSQTDAAKGFGGKYGVQKERCDKSAVGFDYKGQTEQHSSQKDCAKGFGGRYGVQTDRVDKSALGFDYKAQVEQHSSQQDHSKGFGGKFGVQQDRQDKTAHSWSHKEEVKPHQSQTDYAQGFGGKFGVQTDRQDKSAHAWSHKEKLQQHESQTDYAKGFGGRYGVQTDRVDKSASGFGEIESPSSAYEKTQPLEAMTSGAQNLRSRFEKMAKTAEEENKKRAEEEREKRQKREKLEKEGQVKKEVAEYSDSDVSVPAPVPVPRVSIVPSKPTEISPEPYYEPPPIVPPKLPMSMVLTEETCDEQDTYEDIGVLPPDMEDEYEAIPDPPPRMVDEDDGEDYECILEQDEKGEVLYEELPKEVTAGVSAIALYDYEGGGDDEISFEPRDLITDIEMMDEGWWTGSCNGRRGLFPANYVELVK